MIGCPEDLLIITAPGATSATVTWDSPTAVDDSGVIETAYNNFNPGNIFPLGTSEVIYGWIDGSGNEATCVFTVTVVAG